MPGPIVRTTPYLPAFHFFRPTIRVEHVYDSVFADGRPYLSPLPKANPTAGTRIGVRNWVVYPRTHSLKLVFGIQQFLVAQADHQMGNRGMRAKVCTANVKNKDFTDEDDEVLDGRRMRRYWGEWGT